MEITSIVSLGYFMLVLRKDSGQRTSREKLRNCCFKKLLSIYELFTDSLEKSPSSEAISSLDSSEIPHI
jgi:hypothetical protein